jgi:hypothetical protein
LFTRFKFPTAKQENEEGEQHHQGLLTMYMAWISKLRFLNLMLQAWPSSPISLGDLMASFPFQLVLAKEQLL